MMSLGASGSIGAAVTFSSWKGRPYARELVIPANPKSGLQVGFRSMFRFLSQQWQNQSAQNQATFDDLADQIVASPFNAYMRYNQKRWRNFNPPSIIYPAAETDDVAELTPGFAAAAGVASILLTWTVSTLNENWGIVIYRDTSSSFTPSLSNVVQVVLTDAQQAYSWLDSPLVPATYYYNAMLFTLDGKIDVALGEVNAAAS